MRKLWIIFQTQLKMCRMSTYSPVTEWVDLTLFLRIRKGETPQTFVLWSQNKTMGIKHLHKIWIINYGSKSMPMLLMLLILTCGQF